MEYGIYQPMKYATAKTMDRLKEVLNSPDYGIQLKRDGASYVWAKDMDGTVHLYGDKISKKTGKVIDKIDNVPHMKKYAEAYFPIGTQLIVEICAKADYTTGQPIKRTKSSYVNGIMLCTPDKAAARQEKYGWVEAYMFDVLFWSNTDIASMDCADRYTHMCAIFKGLQCEEHAEWFTQAEMITENKDEVIADWIASGEEGGVLKLLHSQGRLSAKHHLRQIGETAARPMHVTYKIKQVDQVDVVITGIELPTSTYTGDAVNAKYHDEDGNPINRLYALGYINAFRIGCYKDGELVEIGTVASGLNDTIREDAALHPDNYIGEVIAVTCMSVDREAHSLRHPRFTQMRPDKAAINCTFEEVFR